ncbi:MAG: Ig-like domain-containing protein [Desulfuromonadaceae bacterium]
MSTTQKGTRNRWACESRLFLAGMFTVFFLIAAHASSYASNVVLQWDVDPDPSVTGYKVYYQADSSSQPFQGTGAVEGPAPIDAHNLTTATISDLDPAHAYYFAVTAYNASGVESSYSNIVNLPELVPPTISFSSPVNNTSVSGTVSVAAGASDNVGVAKVEFYVNSVLQDTETLAPYVYSWNTATLASGSYTLLAKAYDAAGNIGQSSAVTVTVVNDTTPPAVSLTTPANSAVVSGTVTVSANASDNIAVSKVEFYENGVLLFASNTAPYSFSWNTSSVTNGSYTLVAKAYDTTGNIGQSSDVPVTVNNAVSDTTAPTVSAFTMPSTATSLTVAISSFTASDNVGVTGYLVTESASAPSAGAAGWISSAPATFTFSAAGSKIAYAWAKDAAGNVSVARSSSVSITQPVVSTVLTISDALTALQIAVGKVQSTSDQMTRLDVAPYINGKSQPDGKIDIGDVIVILGKVTGKIAL